MTQVWSSSTVHFMLQDPLKAIICEIFNKKVCTFSRNTSKREAGLLIQFYVKSNLIPFCGHLSPATTVEAGRLRAK